LAISLYDNEPVIQIKGWDNFIWSGYEALAGELKTRIKQPKTVLAIECYPGVRMEEIIRGLTSLEPVSIIWSEHAAMAPDEIQAKMERYLTDDRVFGYMARFTIDEFYLDEKKKELRRQIESIQEGLVIVIGFGSSLVTIGDILIYADLARWEIQQRFRSKEIGGGICKIWSGIPDPL
jgi:hypothetical protein